MTRQLMRLNHKQLFNLPVYTTDDTHLGYVVGIELDSEQHCIVRYLVSKHKLVTELISSLVRDDTTLQIAPSQVVSISAERMVVDSTTTVIEARDEFSLSSQNISPAATSSVHQIRDASLNS